jgi:hypothetical protein
MPVKRAPKGYVSLGIPSGGPASHFTRTLFELAMYDQCHGGKHLHPNVPSAWIIGSSSIPTARNRIVEKFLEQPDDAKSDWLLFFDDDQLMEPHMLDVLIGSADAVERPIVALPVWRFLESPDGGIGVTHNVMNLTTDEMFAPMREPLPPDTLLQVAGVGTGCMMIHRSVFRKMADALLAAEMPPLLFREMHHDRANYRESEDLWFCRVAGNAGIPIFVNTTLTIRHVKPIILDREMTPGEVTI